MLAAGAPSCGPKVKQFEEAFAAYCGTRHGLAVSSATTGLELAMIAGGVGPGDEVITTPLSWISTANAIAARGAKVVFADVDPRTLNLDPAEVARKITPRTKAILPVHLYGQCCDMDALADLARPRGIRHRRGLCPRPGRQYKGRKAGSLGDIGVFSFHQQKNMVTLGEGGMVTTSDPQLYERLLSYRSLCCLTYDPKGKYLPIDERQRPMGKRYWLLGFCRRRLQLPHDRRAGRGRPGATGKLDALQPPPPRDRRRYTGTAWRSCRGLTLPYVAPDVDARLPRLLRAWSSRSFRCRKKTSCGSCTRASKIKVWSHYMPIHLTTAYRKLGHREGECPRAEALFHQVRQPADPSAADRRGDRVPVDQHRALA